MKRLSELSTLEGLDVIVAITPYVQKLAKCESLLDEFKAMAAATDDEKAATGYAAEVLGKLVPVFFRDARAELLEIIRIINGMTTDDMATLGVIKAFEAVGELFADPDFITFFRSFVVMKPEE